MIETNEHQAQAASMNLPAFRSAGEVAVDIRTNPPARAFAAGFSTNDIRHLEFLGRTSLHFVDVNDDSLRGPLICS